MDEGLTGSVNETAPFGALLGIEWLAAGPDEVTARLAWDESRCTAGGILHGGALIGLADSATIESKTNFFAAVRGGHVHATARALHKGRRTIVVDTDLRDDEGRLVARVTQTQAVLA